jgi:ABC-type sugar transport system substrate-binding protein
VERSGAAAAATAAPLFSAGVDNDNDNGDDNSVVVVVVVDEDETSSAQGSPYPTTDTLHAGILSNKPFVLVLPEDPGRTSTARTPAAGGCERYGFTYF